jgi:hypothetical protein
VKALPRPKVFVDTADALKRIRADMFPTLMHRLLDNQSIGQVLAYMGDLTTDKSLVRGILVAGGFSARTVVAARVVPNLQLKKYSFNFAFEPIGPGVGLN